jgi:predicted peroxiredoxin
MTQEGSVRLLVKSTSGADDPERCAQAFTVAAAAVTSGVSVSLWLTGEAAWLAVPGRAAAFELAGSAPLDALLALILEAGSVTVCVQCAERRGITAEDCLPGVRIKGATAFVEEAITPLTQALVY